MRSLTMLTLLKTWILFGCTHRLTEIEIEHRLSKMPLHSSSSLSYPYPMILASSPIEQEKKTSLNRLYNDLNENLALLNLKNNQLNRLLAKEMIRPKYSWQTVKTIMKMILKNTKQQTWIKLEAMLKAKNIVRSDRPKKEVDNLRLSIEALNQTSHQRL